MYSKSPHIILPASLSVDKTYHREVLKRPSRLDILQRLLQVPKLSLNLALSLLCVLDSLRLKGLNRLQLTVQIVSGGLERFEVVLDLVDDRLVLQDIAVVREIDRLRHFGQDLDLATRIVVTLLEIMQRGGGLPAETQRAGDLGPVDLEGGAALEVVKWSVSTADSRHCNGKSSEQGRESVRTAAIVYIVSGDVR